MENCQRKLIIAICIVICVLIVIGILCYFKWNVGKKEGYTIVTNSDSKDINEYVDKWINSIKNIYNKSTYVDSRTYYKGYQSPIESTKVYSGAIKYN